MEGGAPRNSWTFLILMFLFAALMTFYLLLPKREGFINSLSGYTSMSIYKDEKNDTPAKIDQSLELMRIALDDGDDLLHLRRCYQFPEYTIERFKRERNRLYAHEAEGGMYVADFDLITCSFQDVQSRIMCELQRFHTAHLCKQTGTWCPRRPGTQWRESNKCPLSGTLRSVPIEEKCDTKIHGPVYALIFQAPYYRNADNQPMSVQFTIDSYGYLPYNQNKPAPDEDAPIYYYVQLLFARYNRVGTRSQLDFMRDHFLPKWDAAFFSKEKQCFLITKNNRERPSFPGGCASTNGAPYSATCLGPKNPLLPNADEKTTRSSFALLYEINPSYNLLAPIMGTVAPSSPPQAPGCGTFSPDKYVQAYGDVPPSETPFQHWAMVGVAQGRLGFLDGQTAAGGLFDAAGYEAQHLDVRRARVPGAEHLRQAGWRENRRICLKKPM
jgi:hypothetical protein